MTWTPVCKLPIIYRPEDVEQMEVRLEILKQIEEKPDVFLQLDHPKFGYFPFWQDRLFEKICKLVKKEAIKEIVRVEGDLQYAKEQIGETKR